MTAANAVSTFVKPLYTTLVPPILFTNNALLGGAQGAFIFPQGLAVEPLIVFTPTGHAVPGTNAIFLALLE